MTKAPRYVGVKEIKVYLPRTTNSFVNDLLRDAGITRVHPKVIQLDLTGGHLNMRTQAVRADHPRVFASLQTGIFARVGEGPDIVDLLVRAIEDDLLGKATTVVALGTVGGIHDDYGVVRQFVPAIKPSSGGHRVLSVVPLDDIRETWNKRPFEVLMPATDARKLRIATSPKDIGLTH